MKLVRKLAIVEVLTGSVFKYLWAAQFTSQIAINVLTFVLTLRIYDLTHKNTAVSLLVLAFSIPASLLGTVAGILVDRYDKKMILLFCNLLRAIAVLGFILTRESIFFVYILVISISVITQFFVPAEAPTIPTLVKKSDLITANSIFMLTIFVTMLMGGLAAGPLIDTLGINRTFLVIALLFLIAAGSIAKLPGQEFLTFMRRKMKYGWGLWAETMSHDAMVRLKEEFAEGMAFIKSKESVRTALFLLVGSQTIVASVSILMPGFADQVLNMPVNDASVLLFGPAILGIITGAAVIAQFGRRLAKNKIISLGLFMIAVFLFLLSQEKTLLMVQLNLFALGFSNALIDVSANTILQEETAEEVRSRVYGLLTSLAGALYIFPVMTSGILSDTIGIPGVFMIAGLLVLSVWLYRIFKK